MKFKVIAIGTRLPDWINTGFQTYAERLPRDFALELHEIPTTKRHKDTVKIVKEESQQLLDAIPADYWVVALDRTGEQIDTVALSQKISQWHSENRSICLLIGGPEGLSADCLKRAQWIWSLSKLTLPHPLARVVVAEQIYRAWSIMTHHPYHR